MCKTLGGRWSVADTASGPVNARIKPRGRAGSSSHFPVLPILPLVPRTGWLTGALIAQVRAVVLGRTVEACWACGAVRGLDM